MSKISTLIFNDTIPEEVGAFELHRLAKNENINAITNGYVPIHLAIIHGKSVYLGELLNLHADLEILDPTKCNAIQLAVKYGDLSMVKMLKANGANLHCIWEKTHGKYSLLDMIQLRIYKGSPPISKEEGYKISQFLCQNGVEFSETKIVDPTTKEDKSKSLIQSVSDSKAGCFQYYNAKPDTDKTVAPNMLFMKKPKESTHQTSNKPEKTHNPTQKPTKAISKPSPFNHKGFLNGKSF